MSARLVVIAGPDEGQAFPLSSGAPLLVGRGRTAAVRLADPHVSRSHCQVKIEGGQVVVEDLDSVSGIFVNDARVRTHALRPGDVLRIGSTLLRLESEDLADQATIMPAAAPPLPREAAAKLPPPAPTQPLPIPAAPAAAGRFAPAVAGQSDRPAAGPLSRRAGDRPGQEWDRLPRDRHARRQGSGAEGLLPGLFQG